MKSYLHLIYQDGSTQKIILADAPEDAVSEFDDHHTGLRLQITDSGVKLMDGGNLSRGIKVPCRFLPAIWNVEQDLPLRDLLAELKRCRRDPAYQLEWGKWLVDDEQGCQFLFLRDLPAEKGPPLRCLDVLDSPELAEICRQSLDIPRHEAAGLGASAVAAIQSGCYANSDGSPVDWKHLVDRARANQMSLPPDHPLPMHDTRSHSSVTTVQVANQTTMVAARHLVDQRDRPLVLNFANGIHPGGGFLHGARAQEECLCRSSALFATLEGDPMYESHRRRPQPDSSNWCILSSQVPFFRTDRGEPLAEPWLMDVITCAAPYAPTVGREISRKLLKARIHRVLSIAQAFGYRSLVLGAWGCGAFGNDPYDTACDFRDSLEGPFLGTFSHVTFAISDWSPERKFLGPFREVFQGRAER